ncbi:hypothetical protein EAXG_01512 [Escherichia coli TA054]|nr:hypothetical protein EAXG_01512 [Escherichia coli TA054]
MLHNRVVDEFSYFNKSLNTLKILIKKLMRIALARLREGYSGGKVIVLRTVS